MTPWQEMFLMYLGIVASIGANAYAVSVVRSQRDALEVLTNNNRDLTERMRKIENAFASHVGKTINGVSYRTSEEE
jgi:hypothetical protein